MTRPDPSAVFAALTSGSPEDATQAVGRLRQRMDRLHEARDRIADLEGVATSEDGLIAVRCTATRGVAGIDLQPRAMRLPSQDLAAAIVDLAAAAQADLDRQRAEVLAELGEDAPVLDVEGSQALLADLNASFAKNLGDIRGVFERFRTGLGR